jgi:broad specificity phosphatase PhoE
MDKPLYLARHGETLWNRERRFQGQMDSPLTARGLEQAQRVGRLLRSLTAGEKDWTIVTSPLGRAHRTAAIIAQAIEHDAARIETDPRLMELNLGSWEGLTFAEIETRSPQLFEDAGTSDIFFRCPDGESYADFSVRIAGWIAANGARDKLIVVAHGLVSRVMRGLYAGLCREECLELAIPQDAVFRVARGDVTRIDCPF